MSIKACFIYPWASFGGIERILLNRAIAFKSLVSDAEMDVLFLHDSGGLKSFKQAIVAYGLGEHARIATSLDDRRYDLISLIDCPQAFPRCNSRNLSYVVECHTTYPENRTYLKKLDSRCKGILAPSRYFADSIANEVSATSGPVRLLRNFVPWDIEPEAIAAELSLPAWSRTPILFFGRLDLLKNPLSLLDAFVVLEKEYPGRFMLILCGTESPEVAIHEELQSRGIRQVTIVLPPVGFSVTNQLLRAVATVGGIFASPSTSESFGLSAAEAISAGLPVILSNIEPHQDLVNNNPFFLYPIDDAVALAEKIVWLADHPEETKNALESLRDNLSTRAFMQDWQALLSHHFGSTTIS